MNFKKLLLAASSLCIVAVSAYAVNKIPLKPDGANAAPCTVFGSSTPGLSCGKTTAPSGTIDSLGTVNVSTSTSSSAVLCLAGSFQTLPTTGYAKGCFAFQLSDSKAYVSTQTVVGSQSWAALN